MIFNGYSIEIIEYPAVLRARRGRRRASAEDGAIRPEDGGGGRTPPPQGRKAPADTGKVVDRKNALLQNMQYSSTPSHNSDIK